MTTTTFDRPLLGINLRIVAGLLAAGMFVSVKALETSVPLGEVVFFRSFFAIIPLVIFLWVRREFPQGLATKRPFGHLMRSGLGALALFTSFAGVARLNLAEVILMAQLSPMLMAIGAVVFLSERLNPWRIIGLGVGFTGVLVMVWPELNADLGGVRLLGFGFALCSAVLSAFAMVMVRNLNKTESPGAIAFYFVIASMIGALFTLPWGWIMPDGMTLALLISAGLFGGFSHIALTLSFRYAEASRLAPFEYIALLWPLLADLFLFRVGLSSTFLIAAPLILAGAAFAALERKPRAPVAKLAS
ncbi:DMT family transporter [Epibacterium ulvae]|uniref:DMT family transporter n=1 Tax=Epibacterium ulvae TaxID=1156985 RepID=UPI002490AE5B|nr:DMT family transporter [Epibacterium ulvae]